MFLIKYYKIKTEKISNKRFLNIDKKYINTPKMFYRLWTKAMKPYWLNFFSLSSRPQKRQCKEKIVRKYTDKIHYSHKHRIHCSKLTTISCMYRKTMMSSRVSVCVMRQKSEAKAWQKELMVLRVLDWFKLNRVNSDRSVPGLIHEVEKEK